MPNYRFVALDTDRLQSLRRRDGRADGLRPCRKTVEPDGVAPCRHCLKDAGPGETVILTSLSPFSGTGPYNERGPIFLHEASCSRATPSTAIPEIVANRLVIIRAYSEKEEIIDADLTEGRDADRLIERLLANKNASFLHVRTARYGCYLCRVERTL